MADDKGLLVVLHADDETWEVDLFDFSGSEWRSMKQHVAGLTMGKAVAGVDSLDAEVLAALLWGWRHRDEPDVTFDHCLDSISLRSVLRRRADEVEVEEEAADPSDPSD